MFEDKTIAIGEGYQNHWLMSVAYGLARCHVLQADPGIEEVQAIERTVQIFYKVLALQVPEPEPTREDNVQSNEHDVGTIH